MVTRSQKIRLGIFVTATLTVLLLVIGSLSYNTLFDKQDIYYIGYEDISVSGLDVGSQVKYLGIKVGSVRKVEIDPDNLNRVIVTVAIEPGTPIKEDVHAEIATIGITGLKLIELRGGTIDSKMLRPGEFIQPGKSLTEDITGKAEIIFLKIELVLNNLIALTSEENQKKIASVLDESASTASGLNSLISENRGQLERTLANIDSLTTDLRSTTSSAQSVVASLDSFLGSDTLRSTMAELHQLTRAINEADIYKLISEFNDLVTSLNSVLGQTQTLVVRNRTKLVETIEEIHLTSRYLHNAARTIDSDPSILLRGVNPGNPPDNRLE